MDYKSDYRFSLAAETLCDAWLAEDAGETACEEKKAVRRLAEELARGCGAAMSRVEGDIFNAASARYEEVS